MDVAINYGDYNAAISIIKNSYDKSIKENRFQTHSDIEFYLKSKLRKIKNTKPQKKNITKIENIIKDCLTYNKQVWKEIKMKVMPIIYAEAPDIPFVVYPNPGFEEYI